MTFSIRRRRKKSTQILIVSWRHKSICIRGIYLHPNAAAQAPGSTTETAMVAIAALWRLASNTTKHLVTPMIATPQITVTQHHNHQFSGHNYWVSSRNHWSPGTLFYYVQHQISNISSLPSRACCTVCSSLSNLRCSTPIANNCRDPFPKYQRCRNPNLTQYRYKSITLACPWHNNSTHTLNSRRSRTCTCSSRRDRAHNCSKACKRDHNNNCTYHKQRCMTRRA